MKPLQKKRGDELCVPEFRSRELSLFRILGRSPVHPPIDHRSLSTLTMSNVPSPSTSRSNLDSIFNTALKTYKKKTGKDITSHPLATELQSCDSPDAILAVLRKQLPTPDQSQNNDETFTKYLIPTVNVLYTLSDTLGEGVSLVIITISSV